MENKKQYIQSLFNDAHNVKFGCVMFDLQEVEDEKHIPLPGSGWASIEGEPAFRIKNTGDLSSEVKWLSNLSQEILWKSGVVKQPKLKHSSYLRTDVGQIMKELGLTPPTVPIAEVCEIISGLFNKVMKIAIEYYGLKSFNQKELYSELKTVLIGEDKSISIHVDESLSRAYQDLVICEKPLSKEKLKEKQMFVTLKRPRYFHAKSIIDTSIPFYKGDWEFFGPDDLPAQTNKKIDFLAKLDRPFVAKVSINSFKQSNNLNVDLNKLLDLGEAIGEGGRPKDRNWACQPELLYLSKFADLNIDAAFVADGYQSLPNNISLPYLGELSDFSYSLGLLAENLWIGLASRSVNPQTRTKTLVTPRACWLKAADRFMTMTSAMMLSSAGFTVSSYGYGGVTLVIDESQIAQLIELAPYAGLSVPINLIEKKINVF